MATVEQVESRSRGASVESNLLSLQFFARFHQRLAGIPQFDDRRGREEVGRLDRLGITQIKRRAVAFAFSPGEWRKPMELLIRDPNSFRNKLMPHSELEVEAINLLRERGLEVENGVDGELIQDGQDRLLLVINSVYGRSLTSAMKSSEGSEANFFVRTWSSLMDRYGIATVVGDTEPGSAVSLSARMKKPEKLIDSDVLGSLREDRYFSDFAYRYNMSATQFCRFRALVRSSQDAKIPVNCEKLAWEIAKE